MKPTERFKRRYISFSLSLSGKPPAHPAARELVHVHFLSFFGESGISSLAFKLVKYDPASGKGVLRCERSRVEEAIFCMACLSSWKGEAARLEPLSTSGTIRRL
ncbi:MAG: Rpp14/Pop5 family protein [Candidatus Micrarchaeia archaeon]|jgi:RNase P/RNase MRP subunit POP5